ncbi:MAG: hypothetical protein ACI4VQ_04950 [Clostridia bacterium]
MKIYEAKIHIKEHNKICIIMATEIIILKDNIKFADYTTGATISYNSNDIEIEYIKENTEIKYY